MSQDLLPHSLVFVAVTAILLTILIRARLPFPLRLAIVAMAGSAYIVHYMQLEALTGWPSESALPEAFDVLGTRVVEPARSTDEPGHIELWIRLDGERTSRLFRVEYDEYLHEEAVGAQARLDEGRAQRGRRSSASTAGSGTGRLQISDKPQTRLPSKGAGTR